MSCINPADSLLAVNGITVGVPRGEVFGLLGVNGAGTSTTYKMLTGNLLVSHGTAYINGHSIIGNMRKVNMLTEPNREIGCLFKAYHNDSVNSNKDIICRFNATIAPQK